MTKVQLYGILDSVSTMKDKTLKVVFRTNELDAIEAGLLQSLAHQEGYCLFASDPLKEEDVPEGKPEFREEKSPSQRLRNTLWVYYEQQGKPGDFEAFRKQKMEQIIDWVKAKLE